MKARKQTYAAGGGQPTSSEKRGDREYARSEEHDQEQQHYEASRHYRQGYVKAGGGYLVRRKKLGGDG